MFNRAAATRVVEIQQRLGTETMTPARRRFLQAEQRRLWDEEFPGRPFEAIAADTVSGSRVIETAH